MKFNIDEIVVFNDEKEYSNKQYKIVSSKIVYRLKEVEREDYGYADVNENLLKKYEEK